MDAGRSTIGTAAQAALEWRRKARHRHGDDSVQTCGTRLWPKSTLLSYWLMNRVP